MQEIVDEQPELELIPQQQHNPTMQQRGDISYIIKFGQIYLSKPTWTEPDQTTGRRLARARMKYLIRRRIAEATCRRVLALRGTG